MLELKLPELAENVTTADVVNVLVKVGDTLQKDQPVLELETEKAVFEVPSTLAGTVKEILVKMGDKVQVGQVLMRVEEGERSEGLGVRGEGEEVRGEKVKERGEEEEKSEELGVRGEGEKERIKETGDRRQETEFRSRKQEAGSRQETVEAKKQDASRLTPHPSRSSELPASPIVRRIAREMGISLREVMGSGPDGRITVEDVVKFSKSQMVGATGRSPLQIPDFSKWGSTERKPMSNVRRTTAEHVGRAWNVIPHVTQFDTADITELEELRKRFAKRVETAGGHLSLTSILLKVAASALKVFPQMNASLDLEKNEIVYKNYFHIGIAVDTERGLLVPVIRDVDKKNILELSVELNQITEKARSKKLTLEEMQGASFTITNLGNIGGSHFTPIIHWPEVAILGVGRAKVEPVLIEGKFEPRTLLPLSLSYDHRLIDGADGARFLRWLADAVTEPFLMDLEG
jgi:pyruvate dehydrogenase E2 component (dihydrolipoamide acetyltransferase)